MRATEVRLFAQGEEMWDVSHNCDTQGWWCGGKKWDSFGGQLRQNRAK